MQSERLTADEAAQRFSVTVRTIFRITRRCRDAMMDVEGEELLALAAD
jgi:predicted DNA-binding transcriptional regulator YafY